MRSTIDPGADHQVAVIGTGVTGAMLGAVLARNGVRVLLLGPDEHPRHEPGELTLPCTSFLYELIAARYRVPEIAFLAFADKVREEISGAGGVHRTFGFAHHTEGRAHRRYESLQFNVPSEHGESHLYRPDVDAWLLALAVRHGAEVRQRVRVEKAIPEDGGVRLVTAAGEEITAACVVDTSGPGSAVAQALGGTVERAGGTTRVLSAHAVGVRPFDEVSPHLDGSPPWHEGTLHHVFDGGVLAVSHFGNAGKTLERTALTSVCLTLTGEGTPAGDGGWAEIRSHLERFPSLAAQFAEARPLVTWADEQPEWHATVTAGDRMLLLDRAALGGSPLLGRDLYVSAQLVHTAAADLLGAARDGDFGVGRFRYLQALQHGMAARQRRLTAAVHAAGGQFPLWNAMGRVWLLGTMLDALTLKRGLKLLNAGQIEQASAALRTRAPETGACHQTLTEYEELLDWTLAECELVRSGEATSRQASDRIFQRLRRERIAPPIYGFGEPDDLDYGLSLRRRLRTLRWVRKDAAPAVRRLVRSYGVRGGGGGGIEDD
ncbi:NAD(P)/FAD-dependent oxidoreductase [Streptomyces sedi]|uniref:Uncharacterized protein n=1 Tax=Streptomyces sedi TaxID=555059 RepID=A0A5C4V490_9ACTN|nr:FAD-dependent monooxygenase [Streptomyces sedi]TNM30593.1 hypothetical protein FH715_11350 [Streptomyces sedi]